MKWLQGLVLAALLGLPLVAAAVIETYEFSQPELETRYQELSMELRCPKCQNQNIADSNAPIARDLRRILYEQLEAGADDEQIRDYMVARYGEFVRYRPRFGGATAVLWLAPLALLAIGITAAVLTLRSRRRAEVDSAGLDPEEEQRLRSLLDTPENRP